MNMKSLVFAFAFLGCAYSASAQKGELNAAKTNYEKFITLKQAGSETLARPSLISAKSSIDKVVLNEKTATDASAWAYKALIDANIAALDTNKVASDNAMKIAVSEYWKSVELDIDKKYADILKRASDLFAQNEFNKAVKSYQLEDFKSAMNSFEEAAKFLPNDTLITHYTGLSAQNAEIYPKAIESYEFCLKTNYSANKTIAYQLAKIYLLQKDTVKAINTAAFYAEKYNDADLSELEIIYSINAGKQKDILAKLQNRLATDPKNKRILFLIGIAYEGITDYKKAEDAYKSALVIDPTYNEASVQIAVLVINNAVDLFLNASKIDQKNVTAYEKAKKQAANEFERSLPLINNAIAINPKSIDALQALKRYYIFKNNMPKVEEITKQITALQ